MTTTADLTDAQLDRLVQAALAEPACAHPRCSDGIHWADAPRDRFTDEDVEEGPCTAVAS